MYSRLTRAVAGLQGTARFGVRFQSQDITPVRITPTLRFKPTSEYYKDPTQAADVPELDRTLLVPTLQTAYAANPVHEQRMAALRDVLNKYVSLPFHRRNSSRSWLSFASYGKFGGGSQLKITQYEKLVVLCKRLDAIDPQLKNDEIDAALLPYRKSDDQGLQEKKVPTLDDLGRAKGTGKRKASSACVYVTKGEGRFLVNGRPLEEMFPVQEDRMRVLLPLQVIDSESGYNVFAVAHGGGKTGQIDAIKLAMSRALLVHNPRYKNRLFAAGCLTRDNRRVERKKPGHLKARKMPTWVKR